MRKASRLLSLIAATSVLLGSAVVTAHASGIGRRVNEFHDSSGKITVSVFQHEGAPATGIWKDETVQLPDPDMVAVGGGGTATEDGQGALLTASYPNADLSGWVVSSKEHMVPAPHSLTTYVIGLKVQGMSRADLLNYVTVNRADSGNADSPSATVGLSSNDYVMLGGGFKVDYHGAGNMGTASFPEGPTTWTARSHDHQVSDQASIATWVVGIRRYLPVGQVDGRITQAEGGTNQHPKATATVESGYALTGGGAELHVPRGSWGNLLWNLQPTTDWNQYFMASGEDHLHFSPATISVYALGIRIL